MFTLISGILFFVAGIVLTGNISLGIFGLSGYVFILYNHFQSRDNLNTKRLKIHRLATLIALLVGVFILGCEAQPEFSWEQIPVFEHFAFYMLMFLAMGFLITISGGLISGINSSEDKNKVSGIFAYIFATIPAFSWGFGFGALIYAVIAILFTLLVIWLSLGREDVKTRLVKVSKIF